MIACARSTAAAQTRAVRGGWPRAERPAPSRRPKRLPPPHKVAAAGAVTSMVSAVGFAGATTGNRQFLRTHLAVSLLVMFLLAAASAIALAKADATETLVRHHWHHIQNEARHIVNNM